MRRNKQAVLSVFDINPLRIGGTEVYARELSSQLAERGWQSILCFNNTPPDPVFHYLSLANVDIEVLHNPSECSWRSVHGFRKILGRYRPEILHLHYVPIVSAYPWLARIHSASRIYFTDQWSRPPTYVPHRTSFLYRVGGHVVSLPITGVVSVSDYVYRCMATSGTISPKRIRRIYNAVDFSNDGRSRGMASHFRQKYSIPEDRALVVQVSWLIPEKGIADLLQAARLVIADDPRVHFVLVGEGRYRDQLVKLAGELGISDHVTWTGLVLNPVAEGVYSAADIVCQVSRWQEAFGWTIAEAMSCSRPVIATRVGGIPELVHDGLTGFLVPSGEPASLAEKIAVLLKDADLRSRMGQMGRKFAKREFDLKENVGELIRFYGLPS